MRLVNPDSGVQTERTRFLNGELIGGILALSMVFVSAQILPIAGTLVLLLGPAMIVFYLARLGRLKGLFMVALALLIAELLGRYIGVRDLMLLTIISVLGISLYEWLRKGSSIEITILCTTGIVLLAVLGLIVAESFFLGIPPQRIVSQYIITTLEESLRLSAGMGTNTDQVAMLKEHLPQFSEWLTYLAPSLLGSGVAFVVWFDIITLRPLFQLRGMPFPFFGDLTQWKAPDSFIWVIIASGFLVLIAPLFGFATSWTHIIGMNGIIVSVFVYFMQGLAIAEFFFRTRRIPRFFRMIFYLLLFLQQYLILLIALMSLFDLWVNWRRFPKARETDDDEGEQ